ncbi:sulfotransferase family protein [Clostridium perfringens]|uniref:sulfotransferase family protein n=1 Tax=Clostridium perfringens TaxID=1502 RepID=UPI002ACDD673|nr:sulfotransferase family protein [Clostridium perfringens]MDZ7545996.1 sulfotransferase family protein [Clostridium perfringens]
MAIKEKKIISCAGFGGTGSSAITDLLSEFDGCKDIGNFEFSILHEVDGISDLHHSVVDDFHRLKTTESLYRFEKLIKNLNGMYKPYLGEEFIKKSYEYMDNIIDVEWKGFWHQHMYRNSKLERRIKYRIPEKIQRKLNNLLFKNRQYEYTPKYIKDDIKLIYDLGKFKIETKKYIKSLLYELDKEDKNEYLILDQLVPPYNIARYSQYVDNLKVIVIDRDPRDLYILNKKYWKEGWIPSENVEVFIKWFDGIRSGIFSENQDNMLFIMLEDLVFNYDETLIKIINFLELDSKRHKLKLKKFNPEVSKKNCRLWITNTEYENDIRIIEDKLYNYCYENRRKNEKINL